MCGDFREKLGRPVETEFSGDTMPIISLATSIGLEITGTGESDSIIGGSGDDRIISNGGGDTIDGGAGSDTAVLLAAHDEYAVAGSASNFVITPIHGGGGKIFQNIEAVQFPPMAIRPRARLAGAAPLPQPAPAAVAIAAPATILAA